MGWMGQEWVMGDRSIHAPWSENHLPRGSEVRTEPTQGCEKDPQRRQGVGWARWCQAKREIPEGNLS